MGIDPDEIPNQEEFTNELLIDTYKKINNSKNEKDKKIFEKRLKTAIKMKKLDDPDFDFDEFIKGIGKN